MAEFKLQNRAEIQNAFKENEREVWIRNFRVACILAFVFVLTGNSLDFMVYNRDGLPLKFLGYRLVCCALLLFIWWLVRTPIGSRYYRVLGLVLPALPTLCDGVMIYQSEGARSSYYAGLNLVLLGAAIILRWTFVDSLLVFLEVLVCYLAACLLHGPIVGVDMHTFFTNIFFIVVTGVFVVIGSHFYNRLRFREFAFRYELDLSKRELETTNNKLSEQNLALEKAYSDLKEAEIQLVQSEKMSTLGTFSAGLMHDILNFLNYSRTGVFVLRKKNRKLPPETQAEADATLNDIEDGLNRIDSTVSGLRRYAHPGKKAPEELDVADLFVEAKRWASNALNERNIALELKLEPGQKIWGERGSFGSVLSNLLDNSIQALDGKKFPDGDGPRIEVSSRSEGGRCRLSIRDNGPGISAQDLPKIFDAFFTTKDPGKGTGLGLSICLSIVREFGGKITVASEPGQYCEFTLDLPATAEAAAAAAAKTAAKTAPDHAKPIRL